MQSRVSITERDRLIVEQMPLARAIALSYYLRCGKRRNLEDITGSAYYGLVQAMTAFRPERGVQPGTFARHRIRGAILDSMRVEPRAMSVEGLLETGVEPIDQTPSMEQILINRESAVAAKRDPRRILFVLDL